MTPEQKRKFNGVVGSFFLFIGILSWLFAWYFSVTPNPTKPAPIVSAPSIDLASCRTLLSGLKYNAWISGQDVVAFEPLTSEPYQQLQKASLAAVACKLPLKTFCMGEGCEQPGVTVVVSKPEISVAKAGKNPAVSAGRVVLPTFGKSTTPAATDAATTSAPDTAKKKSPPSNKK